MKLSNVYMHLNVKKVEIDGTKYRIVYEIEDFKTGKVEKHVIEGDITEVE